MKEMKEKLLGMTPDELRAAAVSCGLKPFIGNQIACWLYSKRVSSWDRMTNIGKAARAALAERYDLGTAAPVGSAVSTDGTRKYLFPVTPSRHKPQSETEGAQSEAKGGLSQNPLPPETSRCATAPVGTEMIHPDARGAQSEASRCATAPVGTETASEAIEAVMIPDDDRRTLCVSSQAGCRMGCRFCMTGRQGFHGNLDTADILNQFLSIDSPELLTNAVFMGMGEPFDNYEAVAKAISVLTADWGFGWSPKRITVSTIGVLPTLKRYLDEQHCHLAVSLHNPFPEERLSVMPVQKAYDIREIISLIRRYDFSGQRRVSFEYTMFAGFNDSKRHADALIRLLRGLECRVNLIRFHKIPDFPYECASDTAMQQFRDRLNNNGITCTIRSSRGEDILAACGMLAGQHSRQSQR